MRYCLNIWEAYNSPLPQRVLFLVLIYFDGSHLQLYTGTKPPLPLVIADREPSLGSSFSSAQSFPS